MACFHRLTTLFWLGQTAHLSQPGCPLAHAVQHVCQLTFLSDATLPATVMYGKGWLLAKRDAFSEPAAPVCHTLRQLGIHSGLSC